MVNQSTPSSQSGAGDIKQQVVQLVQSAMQGDEKAKEQVQQIMKAAESGDQQATQIAQLIQEVVKAMQSQAQRAELGGKLAYIRFLRTGLAPDEEVTYHKCGGKVMKRIQKKACGSSMPMPKHTKKRYFGGSL